MAGHGSIIRSSPRAVANRLLGARATLLPPCPGFRQVENRYHTVVDDTPGHSAPSASGPRNCGVKTVPTEAKEQVEILRQISNIVSSNLSLERVLEALVALAVEVTGSDACLVYLVDHATNEVVLRASQLPHLHEIGNIRLRMGEGITGWVAQHKSVVALPENAQADSRFKVFQALPEDTYQAFLSVPLVSNGELIGVINIQHRAIHRYVPDEIALIRFIGEQMGGAIAKSGLAEHSRTASRRIKALAGLARAISENDLLDRILQAISEVVAETLDSALCSITLVEEDRRDLVISAARCSSLAYLHKMPLSTESSLIAQVIREKHPITVSNVVEEKRYKYPELARKTGLGSLLCVPMLAREKAIGTVNLYTRDIRQFRDDEVGFLEVVAAQAAIAIENMRLMAEMLEMKRQLEDRRIIERAKSILQCKHSLTEEQAYLRLRDESRRLRRPMRDLAQALVLAEDLERSGETQI
jgi:signal transduction protein with GAF and PtsI domain